MKKFIRRRHAVQALALTVAVTALGAGMPALAHDGGDGPDGLRHGKLFISTNAPGGNAVQVWARSASGPATLVTSVPTGGAGTGGGLGSQGALALSGDGRYLFVVNAGSNSVSTFRLRHDGLELTSTVASGGTMPISVAERDGAVYVLNAPPAGTGNNVAGFRNRRGVLEPLADGVRALADASGPAQVGFDAEGDTLVVAEKSATQLVSFRVARDGTLGAPAVTPSPGAVPFGFGITGNNVLVVSEAGTSSASSYRVGHGRQAGQLQLVSPAVANGQGAACWIAVTPNGRFAYSANAATSNISLYGIDGRGTLTLLQAQAGLTSNNGALDLAVTPDGRQLHAFASRSPQQIVSFTIGADGSLSKIGSAGGVVPNSAGLVAN